MTVRAIFKRSAFRAEDRRALVTYTLPGVADPVSYSMPGWGVYQWYFGNAVLGAGGVGAQGGAVIDYDFADLAFSGVVASLDPFTPTRAAFSCDITVGGTGCFDAYTHMGDNALALSGGYLHASGSNPGDYAQGRWAIVDEIVVSTLDYWVTSTMSFHMRFGAAALAAGGRSPIFAGLQTQPADPAYYPSVRFDYDLGGWGVAGLDGVYTIVDAAPPAAATLVTVQVDVDATP